MEEIGILLSNARANAGISLKEVSEDLSIDEAMLTNIEDGKSGAFSDVFVLKNYVYEYAKYLGLDADKVIEEFNEYIFEATSKIPVKEIEKKIKKNNVEEAKEEKIASPYTKKVKPEKNGLYLCVYIIVVLLFILAVFWSVKQITVNAATASSIQHIN